LDSIDIAVAEAGRDGEVRHAGSIGRDLVALDKALRKLISKGAPLHIVYEARSCGFVIWRHLSAQGVTCEVVAPSSIPKRSGDRIKTDRRDAILLARLARAGELTAVRAPDAADEAVRDLVRARRRRALAGEAATSSAELWFLPDGRSGYEARRQAVDGNDVLHESSLKPLLIDLVQNHCTCVGAVLVCDSVGEGKTATGAAPDQLVAVHYVATSPGTDYYLLACEVDRYHVVDVWALLFAC
jgi:hypothetical protein